ncbi:MAG: deoxyguanosinetriphosphate triphosphohydrolase [Hyphomicrobiaceae bacterium]|nr:deoxyguanosinetriphosphate triphosphohydrolase [Hyphomicrobiaceae bacterium]
MAKRTQDRSGPARRTQLASFACHTTKSRGRLHREEPSPTRSDYQRDRDRIVHSTAFRRLNHKTQVFIYHEGDHYRSRLTHSLEVAQIARAIARTLALDEDLAEAIALAHDLGHPPFGHAGERALDAMMSDYGGFDHNGQSLRVVTALERKYAAFDGLNLTWECLEGLAKHNGPVTNAEGEPVGVYAETGLPRALGNYNSVQDLELSSYPSAEAQVAALADDIAYNNHDIDDGFRAGAYALEDLAKVPLAGEVIQEIRGTYPDLEKPRLIYEINRRLITRMVNDAVGEARERLALLKPGSVEDIRNADTAAVSFSPAMNAGCDELRSFLLSWVYRSDRITRIMQDAEQVVADLFSRYMSQPDAMPEHWYARVQGGDESTRATSIADFIAGMTDRYAVREHRRLFDRTPDLR